MDVKDPIAQLLNEGYSYFSPAAQEVSDLADVWVLVVQGTQAGEIDPSLSEPWCCDVAERLAQEARH